VWQSGAAALASPPSPSTLPLLMAGLSLAMQTHGAFSIPSCPDRLSVAGSEAGPYDGCPCLGADACCSMVAAAIAIAPSTPSRPPPHPQWLLCVCAGPLTVPSVSPFSLWSPVNMLEAVSKASTCETTLHKACWLHGRQGTCNAAALPVGQRNQLSA
jgi:hypothetical protein